MRIAHLAGNTAIASELLSTISLGLSPAQPLAAEKAMGRVVLVIEGWNAPDQSSATNAVSIRISQSWRTAMICEGCTRLKEAQNGWRAH